MVDNPTLWSCKTDSPELYYAVAEIGKESVAETRFGYRWLEYSSSGMTFNGEDFKIKGVCNHEDTNCIGMESNKSIDIWKIKMLKECGCNAIKACHNPFSKDFIEACDECGMLVCCDTVDCWTLAREGNVYDFARWFNDWWEVVVETTIKRDMNSPALFMWTVGGEVNLDNMTSDYIG